VIVLFGGTFDPVHHGHLRVAWDASLALDAVVRLMPCHTPPHRNHPRAAPAQRAEMLRLALEGQDRVALDTREVERGGVSYTVDTLRALRAETGADTPVVVLIGSDAFAGLPSWREWRSLFGLAHIGVLTRAGHEPALDPALREEAAARRCDDTAALRTTASGRVLALRVTPLEISSSAVRADLSNGREPRWLVPDPVLRYIAANDLYRSP
jgi:nicotinate-nucleotide adenylyltransferase